MGETSPPTGLDFAQHDAAQAGYAARDAIAQTQALAVRVRSLETIMSKLMILVDEAVVMLANRIAALEDSE